MNSMPPADELAMIRSQILGLRNREQELQRTLLALPDGARHGQWSRAELVTRTMRMFDHRLLPRGVREDPCFWREREVSELRCLPLQNGRRADWDALPSAHQSAKAQSQVDASNVLPM